MVLGGVEGAELGLKVGARHALDVVAHLPARLRRVKSIVPELDLSPRVHVHAR